MAIECTLVLIHGIGNQKKNWSQPFRRNLRGALGSDARRISMIDAYWAPLSTIGEAITPSFAPGRRDLREVALEEETFQRVVMEFTRMLAADAGAHGSAVASFGPRDVFGWFGRRAAMAADVAADVGNYIARNGVRTAMQNVLHEKLGEAQSSLVPVIVVSHSQGTIVSYDVLRQAGANYPTLKTWITMGSPLKKYFAFPLRWGRQLLGMPPGIRWVNLYDRADFVGKDLRGAIKWQKPRPVDRLVDNEKHAGGPHDHWHNPQVVRAVADEVRRVLPSR